MTFLKNFLTIVAAALGSAVLGGVFGAVVAMVSPEFVRGLAGQDVTESVVRYAAGLGMIWGLFLGTAVMGFSLLIATILKLAKALQSGRSGNDSANR